MLKKNAKVYITARSEQKARTTIEELEAETGRKAFFLELELSDLQNVRKAAAVFLR
jgi:retinol dehydrogenase-12